MSPKFKTCSPDGCASLAAKMAQMCGKGSAAQTDRKRIPNVFQTDKVAEISRAYASDGFVFRVLMQPESADRIVAEIDYFFFARTSSTTAQMPAIVNGFEITR